MNMTKQSATFGMFYIILLTTKNQNSSTLSPAAQGLQL